MERVWRSRLSPNSRHEQKKQPLSTNTSVETRGRGVLHETLCPRKIISGEHYPRTVEKILVHSSPRESELLAGLSLSCVTNSTNAARKKPQSPPSGEDGHRNIQTKIDNFFPETAASLSKKTGEQCSEQSKMLSLATKFLSSRSSAKRVAASVRNDTAPTSVVPAEDFYYVANTMRTSEKGFFPPAPQHQRGGATPSTSRSSSFSSAPARAAGGYQHRKSKSAAVHPSETAGEVSAQSANDSGDSTASTRSPHEESRSDREQTPCSAGPARSSRTSIDALRNAKEKILEKLVDLKVAEVVRAGVASAEETGEKTRFFLLYHLRDGGVLFCGPPVEEACEIAMLPDEVYCTF